MKNHAPTLKQTVSLLKPHLFQLLLVVFVIVVVFFFGAETRAAVQEGFQAVRPSSARVRHQRASVQGAADLRRKPGRFVRHAFPWTTMLYIFQNTDNIGVSTHVLRHQRAGVGHSRGCRPT